MEVFKNLPEGTLAELINDNLYMSPSPAFKHQKLLFSIAKKLSELTQRMGEVIISPFDVYLDEQKNAVQPDIIFVRNENQSIIDESGHIHGVPDLVFEILSPGNKEHDLIIKKDLYEKFGVKEYWIVDPETRLTLGYQLQKGLYQKISEELGQVNSPLLALNFQF